MTYILDIVVILVFLLAVLVGYRRGFIKTMAGIVAFVLAIVVASMFAAPLATWSYDTFVEPPISAAIEEQIAAAGNNITAQVDAAYTALPSLVQNLLAQAGIADAQALTQQLAGEYSTPPVWRLMDVIRPLVLPLVEAVCSLLLFIVTSIVAGLLLKVLDIVAKLPVLKQVNKSLGLLAGILSGLLWALIVVTAMQVVAAVGAADSVINLAVLQDTWIVSALAAINPLADTLLELII